MAVLLICVYVRACYYVGLCKMYVQHVLQIHMYDMYMY